MESGAAGLPGVRVQKEGNQEVEAVTILPPVVVEGPALEKQPKVVCVRMWSCSIFGT